MAQQQMIYRFNMESKDKIEYKVWVDMTIREDEDGYTVFDSAIVDDSFPKIVLGDDNNPRPIFQSELIEGREDALIAGLASCMFYSEAIGNKKTHESLKEYISKLEAYFSNAGLAVDLGGKKLKKDDNS